MNVPIPNTTGWGSEVCIKDNNTGPESNASSQKQRQLQKCALILILEKKWEAERSEACGQKGKQTRKNCVRNLLSARFPRHEPQGLSSVLRSCSCSLWKRQQHRRLAVRAKERAGKVRIRGWISGTRERYKRTGPRRAEYHSRLRRRAGSNKPNTKFFKNF